MSQVSVTFLSIRAEDLPQTPEAFQLYVREYFAEVVLHGERCFVAIQRPYWVCRPCEPRKGIAPSHSLEINRFTGGLPDGSDLWEWIRNETARGEQSLLFTFRGGWDDGDCRGDN